MPTTAPSRSSSAPTTAAYRGTVRIEGADEQSRIATLKAKGTSKRGQGGATATIVNTLVETPVGTRVDTVTDFTITGKLARFGRGGMIEYISNRMLRDFAACLQAKLADEQAAAEPEANGAGVIPSPAPPAAEPAAPISATSVLGGVLVAAPDAAAPPRSPPCSPRSGRSSSCSDAVCARSGNRY